MFSFISSFVTIVLSFNIPAIIISNHKNIYNKNSYKYNETKFYLERPSDPTLSCYLLDNGLWKCVNDIEYKVDGDDSY